MVVCTPGGVLGSLEKYRFRKGKVLTMDCEKIHKLTSELADRRGAVRIMEVCGTHTMAIASSGLRSLLGGGIRLVSGPGCPVCVTDQSYIDQAVALALSGQAVVATYGDMVRVPGTAGSLADARAKGADVEVVYSADQAVELARKTPGRQVAFLAVGFETTAPGTALAVLRARDEGVGNFKAFTAHKLILPAMRALLSDGDCRIDAFLCPGHVSVILGWRAYEPIVAEFGKPCVVAGFDPAQIVAAIEEILGQLAMDRPACGSVYASVSPEGNVEAQKVIERVFEDCAAAWRALGVIPASGLALREEFAEQDAARFFDLPEARPYHATGCRCGEVITGKLAPTECGLFAGRCTPADPVGPCMVSSEGACAAAFKYERRSVRRQSGAA
jgi:hydrogenase expression/formation protein HypD